MPKLSLRVITLTVISIFSLICNAQNVHVSGYIKGLKRDSIMIMKVNEEMSFEYVKVKNERFEYTDNITEPMCIQIMGQGKLTLLVEPGYITLTGSAPYSDENVVVSGSRSDSVMKLYLKQDGLLGDAWQEYKTSYDSLKKLSKSDEAKLLKINMNENTNSRVSLMKKYVADYRAEIVGALIPNFCMLRKVLTKADYKEMYAMLSPEIKKTAYGRSVKAGGADEVPAKVKSKKR